MDKEQELLEALKQAVINGDTQKAEELAMKAIEEGVDPLVALGEEHLNNLGSIERMALF